MTQHGKVERPPPRLIDIELEARFEVSPSRRIVREAPPDGSPGPLMWLASDRSGVAVAFGHDMPAEMVASLNALAADEPPFAADGAPAHLDDYLRLLAPLGPLEVQNGLSFQLPAGLPAPNATIVSSGTPEGERLIAEFARDGMPPDLVEMGFREIDDLWAPWRLVVVEGQVASLAFAARLGRLGAELGLATSPAFRGRDLAAAATAAWSAHPDLAGRTLFYSTARSNLASQRVANKLGLPFIGPTCAIVRA